MRVETDPLGIMKPPTTTNDMPAINGSTSSRPTSLLASPVTSSSSIVQSSANVGISGTGGTGGGGLSSASGSSTTTPTHSAANGSSGGGVGQGSSTVSSSSNSPSCFIKPSLSLNSLPPQGPQEASEMAQHRLRIDRPYNSLKKKRDTERELWRRSWGSGHSHSSCSLQSSTTNTGLGKDDFWAALQTNYNFIMDTNLLDSCREARGEIEGPVFRDDYEGDVNCCRKALFKPMQTHRFYGDPRLLRQWIKEMENRVARVPSVTETKRLSIEQLQKLAVDHGEVYREIKSNSRAVAACIRSYERDRKTAPSGKGLTTVQGTEVESRGSSVGSNTSGHTRSVGLAEATYSAVGTENGKNKETTAGTAPAGGGVKGLERRYHLLYLKAFEIQCLLEGLLDSKTSSSDNNASLSDTDEEPASKLARVSNSSTKSQDSLHNQTLTNEEWVKIKKLSNAGFDADSEGSDSEIVPKIIAFSVPVGNASTAPGGSLSSKQQQEQPTYPTSGLCVTVAATSSSPSATVEGSGTLRMEAADTHNLSTVTITPDATILTTGSTKAAAAAAAVVVAAAATSVEALLKENILNNNHTGATGCDQVDGAILDSVNNNGNVNIKEELLLSSPTTQGPKAGTPTLKSSSPIGSHKGTSAKGKQKRSKVSDSSKFNRSNRKSKNCAIFYFKHLDTDSELNKESSEQATKSEASSSAAGSSSPSASSSEGDDEWVYNNGTGETNGNQDGVRSVLKDQEEEEKENKPETITGAGANPADDGSQDHQPGKMTASGGREPKSKKCLDFSREPCNQKTPIRNGRSLMMTSIGSFGKSSESVDGGRRGSKQHSHNHHHHQQQQLLLQQQQYREPESQQQQYATSSIQRLVLHAETLVRDEILAKSAAARAAAAAAAAAGNTPKTVVKNPYYYHHHHHHHHHNYSANHSNTSSNTSNNSSHQQHQQQQQQQIGTVVASVPTGMGPVTPRERRASTGQGNHHHHHHHHHGHGRKAEKAMSNLKMNLIEEWLEKQPLDAPVAAPLLPASAPTTDCEASGEYTDSDSIARDTDSSEGLANSVATCLQGEQTQTSQELLNDGGTSYPSENSNDDEGGSRRVATMAAACSSPSLPGMVAGEASVGHNSTATAVSTVVKRRPHRSGADRPWSVSCMSQLNASSVEINQYGRVRSDGGANSGELPSSSSGGDNGGGGKAVAGGASNAGGQSPTPLKERNFSISESALNTMSRSALGVGSSRSGSMKPTSSQQTVVRNSESKGSLKKRKLRPRRKNRIDESGSDESQPPTHTASTLQLLQQSLLLHCQQYNSALTTATAGGQPLREIQLTGAGGSNGNLAATGITGRRLLKSESFSGRLRLSDDLLTLSSLSGSSSRKSSSGRPTGDRRSSTRKSSQDSEEEFGGLPMAKPEFRIGSLTRTRCGSLNLGSLAALANYNLDGVEKGPDVDLNGTGTGTEEMSSFSEQAWDNYQEKYMSEPYSEDRDTDAARRLLDFGDDYRNFIDSQSDCASSSLSAANMDSLSPPRFRSKVESLNKSDTTTNSLNRRKRLDEYRMDDRYGNNMNSWSSKSGSPPHSTVNAGGRKHSALAYLDATPLAPMAESGGSSVGAACGTGSSVGGGRRRSLRSVDKHGPAFVRSVSHETSSSSNNEFDEDMEAEVKKLLIQSKLRFANTEALKAKCHLLKPDDYSEIITTCRENVRCLESVLRCQPGTVLTAAKCQDLRDTIVCWEGLLSWSERRVISNQFQGDVQQLKEVLEQLGSKTFNICSESHIQLAIDQLKNEHKVLQNQRPKMLTLNATVHNWVSNQELQRKELLDPTVGERLELLERDKNFARCHGGQCGACYDCLNDLRQDTAVNRELKDGITALYGAWDEAEVRIRNRIENLTTSMMTWKQLEDGLIDFRDTLDRDRGKLQGIEGALQSGNGASEEIVNSVKEVVKALSEKVDPLFHEQQQQQQRQAGTADRAESIERLETVAENAETVQNGQLEQQQQQQQQLLAPVLATASKIPSNGSLSDSGISDGGGMSDGSLSERERRLSALKRLVKQLEVSLAPGSEAMQTITKRLEMAEHDLRSLQSTCRKIIMNEKNQQDQQRNRANVSPAGKDDADGNNNNSASVKNKNKKSPSRKKNRNTSPRLGGSSSADVTEAEDDETLLLQEREAEELQRHQQQLLAMQKSGTTQLGIVQTTKMKLSQNRWVWRITKIAVPVQLALVLVMCAACFFEPHCCDALNTYSMSFTPQLRYLKGPPPI